MALTDQGLVALLEAAGNDLVALKALNEEKDKKIDLLRQTVAALMERLGADIPDIDVKEEPSDDESKSGDSGG